MGFFIGKRPEFRDLSEADIKNRTRILVIDNDAQDDLVDYCFRHGWRVKYLADLDSFENTDLIDSHIVCVDINGVGQQLRKLNGLDIAYSVKTNHPDKKVIVYSTRPMSDFFHPVNELLDKRILKQGDYEPFIASFRELGFSLFSWESLAHRVYSQVRDQIPFPLSYIEFRTRLEKATTKGYEIDAEKVAKVFRVAVPLVRAFIPILLPALKVQSDVHQTGQ